MKDEDSSHGDGGPALTSEENLQQPNQGRPQGIVVTVDVLLGMMAAALIVCGSLGTWVSAGVLSVSGIHGDGVITLVAGVIGVVVVGVGRLRPVALFVAIGAVATAIYDTARISSLSGDSIGVSVGWGLVAVLTGSAGLLAWSLYSLWTRGDRRVFYGGGALASVVLIVSITLAAAGAFSTDDVGVRPQSVVSAGRAPADTEAQSSAKSSTLMPIGGQVRLHGSNGLEMVATVERVIDPVYGSEYDEPAAGKRYVAIVLRLTNTSEIKYDDSPSNGAALIYGDDREASASLLTGGQCAGGFASSAKISAGGKRKGCIVFEVPRSNTIKTFQLSLDSGFADDAGDWNVRPANDTSPHRRSVEPEGDDGITAGQYEPPAAATGASTACDQNITAGPGTTCGFANAVFKAYASRVQASGGADQSVSAYSPAAGHSVEVYCSYDGTDVTCAGGDDALVTFPKWAADVY